MVHRTDATLSVRLRRPLSSRKGCQVGSTKSKSGCQTCKIRRIKCDEKRPNCDRCTSTGRKCEYQYVKVQSKNRPSSSAAGVSAIVRPLCSIPARNSSESRAFAFFFNRIAPVFSGNMDLAFWCQLIPRLSLSEPCIWDAVVSISILYEHPQYADNPIDYGPNEQHPITDEHHILAVRSYNRAITRFNDVAKQGVAAIPLALVSCILFICIEFLQDNITYALKLYGIGCKMLRDSASNIESRHVKGIDLYEIHDLVAPIVSRLGIISAIGSGPPPPPEHERYPTPGLSLPTITDLATARYTLHTLMIRGHATIRRAGQYVVLRVPEVPSKPPPVPPPPELLSEQAVLLAQADAWQKAFSSFIRQHEPSFSRSERALTATLWVYFNCSMIWYLTYHSPSESIMDQHTPLMEKLVHHARIALDSSSSISSPSSLPSTAASQPTFTLEIGVIPPLYTVVQKCHHPRVRREALALLRRAPRKEGPWKSVPLARQLERTLEIEEAGMYPPGTNFWEVGKEWELPPEERRIRAHRLFRKGKGDGSGEVGWWMKYTLMEREELGEGRERWAMKEYETEMENM